GAALELFVLDVDCNFIDHTPSPAGRRPVGGSLRGREPLRRDQGHVDDLPPATLDDAEGGLGRLGIPGEGVRMPDSDRTPVRGADLEWLERPLILGSLEFLDLHYTDFVQGWQGGAVCGAPISQNPAAVRLAESAAGTAPRRERGVSRARGSGA